MPPEFIAVIADAGVAGVSLGIMAWLFLKMLKIHREERDEFRNDIKEDREKANIVLSELTSVIKHNNRLLDKFEGSNTQARD